MPRHPTPPSTGTHVPLLRLLQEILEFAALDRSPHVQTQALVASRELANKAMNPPCIHFRGTFDEDGTLICFDCGKPI
jgi:hypothetical protein